ncbi:MAG: cell wall-binding repeat-containing protein [Nakamurella sp.]
MSDRLKRAAWTARLPWLYALLVPMVVAAMVAVEAPAVSWAGASGSTADVIVGWGTLANGVGSPIDYGSSPQGISLPGGVRVSALAAGGSWDLALGSDGAVYSWGFNDHGQLGTGIGGGSSTAQPDPARVALPDGVTATALSTAPSGGWGRSFAVGSDGAAYMWGDRDDCHPNWNLDENSPPIALALPSAVPARQVAGGMDDTFILDDDGAVYAAGGNGDGELGIGAASDGAMCTPTPVAMPFGVTAISISVGAEFALAIGSDGQLYAWGRNDAGELGDGTTHDSGGPVKVQLPAVVTPTAISAGSRFALATGSDGHLYAWGVNYFGQLGDGTTTDAHTPVQVALPTGVTPTAISAGGEFGLADGSDGHLYAWGGNNAGQLGDGTTTDATTPVRVQLSASMTPTAISAGYGSGLAVGDTVAPAFVRASPPTTVTTGAALDYTFAATGLPAPTFALDSGAPSWLAIDPDSGELTGTVPANASTFGFSVTATNSAGSATAGPFTMAVPSHPVDVSGAVIDQDGHPVIGAEVDICAAVRSVCTSTASNASGAFTATTSPGASVVVTVYPPQTSGLLTDATGEMVVPPGGLSGISVRLLKPSLLGDGVSVTSGLVGYTADGEPIFDWNTPATIQVADCPNGIGQLTLSGRNFPFGNYVYGSYPLTENPAGSGTYIAMLPPQIPIHGPVNIEHTVICPDSSAVEPAYGLTGGGASVTITGAGLTGAMAVTFGTDPASNLQSLYDGLLTVTAPAGNGTEPVVVTLASGVKVTVGNYNYVAASSVPGLHQSAFRSAAVPSLLTASALAATQPDPKGAMPVGIVSAIMNPHAMGLFADSPNSSESAALAKVAEFVFAHFPGGEAGTLRSAIATALAVAHPSSCLSDRTGLKAAIHLAIQAAIMAEAAALAPSMIAGAEVLLSAIVDPLLALVFSPAVAWLVKTTVGVILNKIADAIIDAALDAALGPCPHPTNALIDPSGTVIDTHGNPVDGATATILRSDTASGPFTAVDVTKPGIDPAVNPETTGEDGAFQWDVRAGSYEIQASKTDCTAADDNGDNGKDVATIGPYPVPPPQVGLTITLQCLNEPAAPTPVVSSLSVHVGAPAGGTDLIVSGSGFAPSATVTVGAIAAATVTYLGPNAIELTTPAGVPGPADVRVHTVGGDSATSSADKFFYGAVPAVTAVNAASGPIGGGTEVTITGSGFTGANVVGFDGIPGTDLVVDSDNTVHVTTPQVPAAGIVDVEVVTPAGANPAGAPAWFSYVSAPTASNPPAAPAPAGSGAGISVLAASRIAGKDRFDTSALIAEEFIAADPAFDGDVVIANGESAKQGFDGLSANYLAGARHAPILLTQARTLPPSIQAALRELYAGRASGTIYVMGGSDSVSDQVAGQALAAARVASGGAVTLVRVAGDNRYATAAAAADAGGPIGTVSLTAGGPKLKTAFLASGEINADALAAGAISGGYHIPVLLTQPGTLSGPVAAEIKRLGIRQVIVLGGADRVSPGVVAELAGLGVTGTKRIAGTDRFDTSARLDEFARAALQPVHGGTTVYLVNGLIGFPDALSVGPLAGATGSPIVTTPPGSLPKSVADFLTDAAGLDSVTALGQDQTISQTLLNTAQQHLH